MESVIRSTQSDHEQQMILKGNEIKQVFIISLLQNLQSYSDFKRDNIIKSLEARKGVLETQVARALTAQVGCLDWFFS